VTAMRFEDVAEDFVPEGAWRDIYVLNTTIQEWDRVLQVVRSSYGHKYSIANTPAPMPDSAEAALEIHHACQLLEVDLGRFTLNCHFFCEEEIEFDMRPQDVDAASFPQLVGFLTAIGTALQRNVFVTYENHPGLPILVYEAATNQVRPIRTLAEAAAEPRERT
jgi:hypothetical protein